MLSQLQVKDFAIIDELSVEFDRGLTILSGETGAGKSILIDALSLVLGGRADKTMVAEGAKQAEITAVIDIREGSPAADWLTDQALANDENELILRRVISADGRSRAFANASPINLQSLSELGESLVEIHGQHAHQLLTRADTQRDLVDRFGSLLPLAKSVADAYATVRDAETLYAELVDKVKNRAQRAEFARFQLQELEALGDTLAEFDTRVAERDKLAHVDKLAVASRSAIDALYDDETGNALGLIARAISAIDDVTEIAPELAGATQLLGEADAAVQEAADSVRRYAADLSHEPARRDQLENEIAAVREAARKHGCEVAQLDEQRREFAKELSDLDDTDDRLATLDAARTQARKDYFSLSRKLSRARLKFAKKFSIAVSEAMQGLGMAGGNFVAELSSDADAVARNGSDKVDFLVSANAGRTPRALAKVASGGELSRISLAIQVIAADVAATPTMIFDEVDSGIGGGVAEIVGQRLRQLGESRQVLCVTHLAQVASCGHQHFRITKMSDERTTRTRLVGLDAKDRVDEIARMLGGTEITKKSLAHANEMLAKAAGNGKKAKSA